MPLTCNTAFCNFLQCFSLKCYNICLLYHAIDLNISLFIKDHVLLYLKNIHTNMSCKSANIWWLVKLQQPNPILKKRELLNILLLFRLLILYIYICLKKVPKISNKCFHHLNIFGCFPSYRNFVLWMWETQACTTGLKQRALPAKDTMSFDPTRIPWCFWKVSKSQVPFPDRSFHAATLFWRITALNNMMEALLSTREQLLVYSSYCCAVRAYRKKRSMARRQQCYLH